MSATTLSLSRLIILLIVGLMLVSGCSNSNDPQSAAESVTNTADGENLVVDDGATNAANDANQTVEQTDGSSKPTDGSANGSGTKIIFNITVPAYKSNALQVRVKWGEKDLEAMWVVDETWTASGDFPTNTQNQLSVTFSDNIGSTTLASFETPFKTGSSATQTYNITAEQFDTDRWDDDSDGISNLDELHAEPNPVSADPAPESGLALSPVTASVELLADKTFRISWEHDNTAQFYRVLENPDGVSGYKDVSGELDVSTDYYDHRVALHKRVNARYIVEACNVGGCVTSAQQLIEGTLEEAIGYFKASDASAYNFFGTAVSLSADGKTMAVGAVANSVASTGIGAVHIFSYSETGWQQQANITASNNEVDDEFGETVSLSADGNTLVVGAPFEASAATGIDGDQSDNSAEGAGAVYVFTRSGDDWRQQAYLKASNNRDEDLLDPVEGFGSDISLSADGNTLAVGATYNGRYSANPGAVFVFQRSNSNWQQQVYFDAPRVKGFGVGHFGHAISLSADGNTLAAGIYDAEGDTTITTRGADAQDYYGGVYVFVRTDENWKQQAFIRAGTGSWVGFGDSLILSADGNLLAASTWWPHSVQMFERTESTWEYKVSLKSSNEDERERFGSSLSLSADGSTLAIGAPEEDRSATGIDGYLGDEFPKTDSGAVYVFTRPDGIWQQLAYVKASNSQPAIGFGSAISLSANGETMAISAPTEANATSGINGDQHTDVKAATAAGAVYLY